MKRTREQKEILTCVKIDSIGSWLHIKYNTGTSAYFMLSGHIDS